MSLYLSPFGKDPSLAQSKIHIYEPQKWKHYFGSWDDQTSCFEIRKRGLIFKWWYDLRHIGITACEVLYSDPEYLNWVKSAPKYDLVIVEISLNECAYGLVRLWGSKLVVYSTTTVVPWMVDIHGIPDESSSISDTSLRYPPGEEMAYFQRCLNALVPLLFSYTWQYDYLPKLEEITAKGLGIEKSDQDLPSFWEVGRNTSLVLLSSHFTLDFPRSLPPHFVEIGGIVVSKKEQSLEIPYAEMNNFINSGAEGFIYISFGTLAEFTSFDVSIQQEFIKALEHFPNLQFIWKSTSDITFEVPKNVFVTKWAPQQGLLAHPKIKGFITHGGMGSVTEAVHFGVPIICLPIHAEQELNANTVIRRGAGIKLEIVTLVEAELERAIFEILNNPRYRKAMTKLSTIFKDRPSPPLKNAVWWIEYVLRQDNSQDYLVPGSAYQPGWKRRQVDIWIILGIAVITLLLTFVIILSLIFYQICRKLRLLFSPKYASKSKKNS